MRVKQERACWLHKSWSTRIAGSVDYCDVAAGAGIFDKCEFVDIYIVPKELVLPYEAIDPVNSKVFPLGVFPLPQEMRDDDRTE